MRAKGENDGGSGEWEEGNTRSGSLSKSITVCLQKVTCEWTEAAIDKLRTPLQIFRRRDHCDKIVINARKIKGFICKIDKLKCP